MLDLNVWAGRTSDCFRDALTGIAFGLGFDLCGSRSGRGGRASTSGQGSLALPEGMAGNCDSGAESEALATCPVTRLIGTYHSDPTISSE
jgi:hypothetical protein